MRRRLEREGRAAGAVAGDPELDRRRRAHAAAARNEWARENGLADRFVVMHSGQRRPRAGSRLAHSRDDVPARPRRPADRRSSAPARGTHELVGARRACSRPTRCASSSSSRERLCRSRSRRPTCTSSGSRGASPGYVVPSRLYGVLAAGRPVIAAAEDDSETAQLVREAGCGIVVPPATRSGSPRRSARATTASTTSPRWGGAHASTRRREADRSIAVARYRAVLEEVLRRSTRDRRQVLFWVVARRARLDARRAIRSSRALLARRAARAASDADDSLPTVAVIVAAYNEEAVIERRIAISARSTIRPSSSSSSSPRTRRPTAPKSSPRRRAHA